jgi:SMI1 / KNR4 family (SUKH-1)
MTDDDVLFNTIRRNSQLSQALPPLTESEVQEAERLLGFRLPSLLRRLYLEVSNGDFGASCMPLILPRGARNPYSAETVVSLHWAPHSAGERVAMEQAGAGYFAHWPRKVLIFLDQGCNMYSCVDCSKPELPVLYFDGNMGEGVFALEAPSLYTWFRGGFEPWRGWDAAPKIRFDEFESAQATDTTDKEGTGSDGSIHP